jgi:TRAP transporter TAXI family solute receptor
MKQLSMFRQMGRALAGGVAGAMLLAGVSAVQAAENFRLSTLGPGSSPYVVMTTFANIINEQLPEYQIQVNATGAATRHAVETGQGKSEFFMTSPNLHQMMETGTGPFSRMKGSDKLAQDLRSLFYFPLGYYHIITYADSGIDSLDDLKGKRVFNGPPGGVATITSQKIIEAATGLKPDKDYQVVKLGWDAAAQSFQDGHIDVYVNSTLAPSPVISQMALTRPIRLLSIPQEALSTPGMQALLKTPGYKIGQIPADIYGENQVNKEGVAALKAMVAVATHKGVSDEAIYRMTKAFWEGLEQQTRRVPQLRAVEKANALEDLNMPLHPGALRYYREIGLEIPEAATAN